MVRAPPFDLWATSAGTVAAGTVLVRYIFSGKCLPAYACLPSLLPACLTLAFLPAYYCTVLPVFLPAVFLRAAIVRVRVPIGSRTTDLRYLLPYTF